MQALLGVIFHFIGGCASGSFYVPFKKVVKWSWESYWLIGGLFSWLIMPPLAAMITVPGFAGIIRDASWSTLMWTYSWGLLWGIGGLTYGLGIRYLGMSLGNSILLGLTAAFGSLIPALYYDINPSPGKTSFSEMLNSAGGQLVIGGILVCIIGIAVCGIAGRRKERQLPPEKQRELIKEFHLGKGLTFAIISGILSACFNYGIEAGEMLADSVVSKGMNPLFQNNATYVVLLWGGLTTNFIWCIILNLKNRSYSDYTDKKTPLANNYFFAALAGTVWYFQFFFYGMGESKLGNGASSWILHMAFIILVANMWGLVLREWKGVSKKTLAIFIAGLFVIICSVVMVGIGNSLPAQKRPLAITRDAHIVLIGNNLCSRMINYDHFETELHMRYPDSTLFVRNMCDGGNSPGFRPHASRNSPWAFPGAEKFQTELANYSDSKGFFETEDQWLARLKADIIIAFFGYNESFEGQAGLENFKSELNEFIRHTLSSKYNSRNPPRLVIVSPIAFEHLPDPNLPDGKLQNQNISLYTAAMQEIAEKNNVLFVNVFAASKKWYTQKQALTIDGSQLNDAGYRKLSAFLIDEIFGRTEKRSSGNYAEVHHAVDEKNWMWLNDFKVPNGVHIYGRRYQPFGPENYPAEISKIREMTNIRDKAIWAAAKGNAFNIDSAIIRPLFYPRLRQIMNREKKMVR